MTGRRVEMIGRRFGRLTVTSEAERRVESSGHTRRQFHVKCDCGNENIVDGYALRSGNTQSCGCYHSDKVSARSTVHGDARTGRFAPEYNSYVGMLQRCRDKNHARYKDYGGRGITVCDRWISGEGERTGYECFKADMGLRPSKQHTIERRENDGNYCPSNCYWATRSEQQNNKRRKLNVTIDGATIPLVVACRMFGGRPDTARKRILRGVPPKEAVRP